MKKILIVLACLLLITGCKDVKLDNGESAVVTFKKGGISSSDLYAELKKLHGGEAIANLIDLQLLSKDYPSDSEEEKYVNQTLKTLRKNAKDSGTTTAMFIQMYYGLSSEDALKSYSEKELDAFRRQVDMLKGFAKDFPKYAKPCIRRAEFFINSKFRSCHAKDPENQKILE